MRLFIQSILTSLIVFSVLCTDSQAALKLRHIVSVYLDTQDKGLKQPEGVACNNEGQLVVADTGNGRLVVYAFHAETARATLEIKMPQMTSPVRVQIGASGNILALDEKQRRIVSMSPAGEFKGYLEPVGLPGLTPIVPRSFKIDGKGTLYVLDIFSKNVVVLDAEGKFLRNIAFPDHFGFMSDLAVDFKETILLIDSVDSVIYAAPKDAKKFSPLTKSLKKSVSFPTSITTDKKGTIYVTDQTGGDIVIFGQDGSFQGRQLATGWKEGLLRYPSQTCVNEKGVVFVADRQNNRIQIYQSSE